MSPGQGGDATAYMLASLARQLMRSNNPATGQPYTPREAWAQVRLHEIGPLATPETAAGAIRAAQRMLQRVNRISDAVQGLQPGETFRQAIGRMAIPAPMVRVEYTVRWSERQSDPKQGYQVIERHFSQAFSWDQGPDAVQAQGRAWLDEYAAAKPQLEVEYDRQGQPLVLIQITGAY